MEQHADAHIPVLRDEVISGLDPKRGDSVLDCTVGLGGHAVLLLDRVGQEGSLTALDADEENLNQARSNLNDYAGQCTFHHANFRDLNALNLGSFDIIFADLGISSVHIDDPQKGFSFREDGLLDMRLDQSSGITAAELIAQSQEADLADILYQYGEIRQSRKLALALKEAKPKTTLEAKAAVESIAGSLLPQAFQALRIAVNDELGSLRILLDTAPQMLKSGGRLGIISFHSLEDRMVKETFKDLSTPATDDMTGAPVEDQKFALVTKKAIKPSDEEIDSNPRSRSARLRVIAKV